MLYVELFRHQFLLFYKYIVLTRPHSSVEAFLKQE